ncbi:hypothetical protein FACS1894153_0740 [Bacteroidia bacterium]|nr:hypothetical protein FACS1894153_0740 [Bacteroidia bacterium]
MFFACYITAENKDISNKKHFSYFDANYLIGNIIEEPIEKEKSVSVTLRIFNIIHKAEQSLRSNNSDEVIRGAIHNKDDDISVIGKALVYIKKDTNSLVLKYGDVLVLKNKSKPTEPLMLSATFDYKKYLERKNIYHTAYLYSNEWVKIGGNKGNHLVDFAYNIRQQSLRLLSKYGLSGKEYAVGAAILLGSTNELDPLTRSEYQTAGVMHILCVSGMHLGLFAMMLSRMLFFLKKNKWQIFLKSAIILVSIWSYSLITGFCPSVLRSAVMFSFITVGQCLNRSSDVYNSLSISALILLVINPNFLYNTGFQLSYLAVIGIVMFQPLLNKIWIPKQSVKQMVLPKYKGYSSIHKGFSLKNKLRLLCNKVLGYIWELTAVSIAAQLATAVLVIYYFNVFPNYFLLANYVASPLSTIILPVGMAAIIVCSTVPQISFIAIFLLKWSIKIMNTFVAFIEKLPFATTDNLSITLFENILLYIGFLCAFIAIKFIKKKYLLVALSCFTMVSFSIFFRII